MYDNDFVKRLNIIAKQAVNGRVPFYVDEDNLFTDWPFDSVDAVIDYGIDVDSEEFLTKTGISPISIFVESDDNDLIYTIAVNPFTGREVDLECTDDALSQFSDSELTKIYDLLYDGYNEYRDISDYIDFLGFNGGATTFSTKGEGITFLPRDCTSTGLASSIISNSQDDDVLIINVIGVESMSNEFMSTLIESAKSYGYSSIAIASGMDQTEAYEELLLNHRDGIKTFRVKTDYEFPRLIRHYNDDIIEFEPL